MFFGVDDVEEKYIWQVDFLAVEKQTSPSGRALEIFAAS